MKRTGVRPRLLGLASIAAGAAAAAGEGGSAAIAEDGTRQLARVAFVNNRVPEWFKAAHGRGLHSSTCQLNPCCFCHSNHQTYPSEESAKVELRSDYVELKGGRFEVPGAW